MNAACTLALSLLFAACAASPSEPPPVQASTGFVMRADKNAEREIVITRTFAAPRTAVFAALTEPAQVRQWLEATGFTLVTCDLDLRVGGRARYLFERTNGRRIEVHGEFDLVDPPRAFAYRETYDFSPLVVHVRTDLAEIDGVTTLRQVMTYGSEAERDTDYPGVATSSREAFGRLSALLTRGSR